MTTDGCEGFSAFLHNPKNIISPEEDAAILCWTRKERFISGYYIQENLKSILLKYFNTEYAHKNGLEHIYTNLVEHIKTFNLIGLFLWGYYKLDDSKDEIILKYKQQNGNIINLTINSICTHLLKTNDRFSNEELISLCKRTPNFEIYYKPN